MTQTVQSAPPGPGADEFRLDGYVALVTGAGRGIGAGIAQAYARAGADLVLVARTAGELEDVAAAVQAAGRSATVIPADLTDVSRAVQIVERAIAGHGMLDILVNNTGGAMPAAYLDTTPEALDKAFHEAMSRDSVRMAAAPAVTGTAGTGRPRATASNSARAGPTRPSASASSRTVSRRGVAAIARSRSLTDRGLSRAASASSAALRCATCEVNPRTLPSARPQPLPSPTAVRSTLRIRRSRVHQLIQVHCAHRARGPWARRRWRALARRAGTVPWS